MPLRFIRSQFHGLLVAAWLTLSIASVVMAAVNWQRLSRSMDAADRQTQLNDAVNRTLLLLSEAESAERSYLITGRKEDLEPYLTARKNLPEELASLKELSGSNEPRRAEVIQLRELTELRMNQLATVIQTKDRGNHDAATARVGSGEAQETKAQIRSVAGRILQDRIAARGTVTRNQLNRANITSLVAGLVGVGTGLFSLYLARVGFGLERRELALSEAKQRAESSSREKSAFLANISHEIRTPMNSILGFSDLLACDPLNPRQKRHLHSIHAAAESLLQLINDVLDMSKVEAGVVELHPEPTAPAELAEFLQTVFAEQLAQKGLAWSCEVAQSVPPALLLDRTRLRQVLVNLVGNAVKFTEHGSIRLRMLTDPEVSRSGRITLLVEVEDTGMGIPPDRLDAIFKPFVQADGRRAQERQGTGLGLAIVKRLTEMMGGSILVASITGRGTTFQIRIPNLEACQPAPRTSRRGAGSSVRFDDLAPARVLVVDDHPMNRELVAAMFDGSHHQLRLGNDGIDALALAAECRPDVVLLDIRMPGMDGRQVLAELRAIPGCESIPVIAVTASGTSSEDLGPGPTFDGFLRKPFGRHELHGMLERFLPKAQLESVTAPEPVPAVSREAVPHSVPAEWSRLINSLRSLESLECNAARESGSFHEARAFGNRLLVLAQAGGCAPLERLAQSLLQAAEDYDAVTVEQELIRFPALIRELEAQQERTSA